MLEYKAANDPDSSRALACQSSSEAFGYKEQMNRIAAEQRAAVKPQPSLAALACVFQVCGSDIQHARQTRTVRQDLACRLCTRPVLSKCHRTNVSWKRWRLKLSWHRAAQAGCTAYVLDCPDS